MRATALAVAATLLATACGSGGGGGTHADAAGERGVPAVDLSRHEVPLDDVHFDTFDGGSVRLADASPELIERLRDAIPPLDEPRYVSEPEGGWLADGDAVVGYEGAAGTALAYPLRILNFHELVTDTVDGVPVLVTYCPLCRSGVVFDRRLGGRELTFGNTSALYENDLVMYDHQTGSYWWQTAGRAIVGALSGERLDPLPSSTTTWGEWRRRHPGTRVLSRDTGFARDYDRDPFERYAERVSAGRTPFPVDPEVFEDERLDPATVVIGVESGGEAVAFPVGENDAVFDAVVGGTPVVVLVDGDSGGASAYSRRLAGRVLRFDLDEGRVVDTTTGSTWDLAGRATSGPLAGERLEPVPSRSAFWFAYLSAFPDARVAGPAAT